MAGVESLRFCIPFSYRAMYKCLLIIIIIILPWKIVFKLFKVVIADFFHVFKLNEVIQVNSHCHRCKLKDSSTR